jgi:hypothetical protein
MTLQPLWALAAFQFPDLFTIGRTLGQVISSSQGLYLNAGQHKHRINTHTPNIHAISGIRTHDHSVRTSEDSSCLTPLGHRDRLPNWLPTKILPAFLILHPGYEYTLPWPHWFASIWKICAMHFIVRIMRPSNAIAFFFNFPVECAIRTPKKLRKKLNGACHLMACADCNKRVQKKILIK